MKITFSKAIISVMLFFGVLELGLRFVDYKYFSYRVWEIASRFPTSSGPFEPDKVFSKIDSMGDLGHRVLDDEFRTAREERFVIDSCGFRNERSSLESSPDIVLLGDSYVVGSGVSDEDSPGQVLERISGKSVYNLGGKLVSPEFLASFKRHTGMKSGRVLLYFVDFSYQWFDIGQSTNDEFCSGTVEQRQYKRRVLQLGQYFSLSRFEQLAQSWLSDLYDDYFLPSPFHQLGFRETLLNSEQILFWKKNTERTVSRHDEELLALKLKDFSSKLSLENLDFTVVLLPSSYSSYHKLIENPKYTMPTSSFLMRFHKQLEERGVRVINLEKDMRQATERAYREGKYLYWRDDTHWNADGIEVASGLIARRLNLVSSESE